MNIVCVICSDLLVPSDDVFHTPCGHIFHYGCLLQWLERAKTCPQCREKTTEHKIHRLYFNFSNNDSLVEDATSLQNKLDNATFQLKLKDNVINTLTETKNKLETQTSGLRQEVKNVEIKLNSKESAIRALQTQIKFFKQQCAEIDEYRKDYKQLQEKVEILQNMQVLLEGSAGEVDEMIAMTSDHTKLVTYIGVLKREMTANFNKRRKLEHTIRSLEQKLMESHKKCKVLEKEHIKRKELEEQLNICETEKRSLQTQLLNKQTNMHCVCNKVENQNNLRRCFENNEENFNASNEKEYLEHEDILKPKKDDSCIIIESDNENTPQNMKSEGFFSLKELGKPVKRTHTNLKIPPILVKKPKFSQPYEKTVSSNGMTYDGFGGHARLDEFPSGKLIRDDNSRLTSYAKKIKMEAKRRKLKLDTGDNKKLNDMLLIDV